MFVPHSEIDLKKMFEELSISSLDDLFTHIPETLLRGIIDDVKLEDWLYNHIWKIEPQMKSHDAMVGTKLGIAEMISCGTIGFVDQFYYAEEIAKSIIESGVKGFLAPSIFNDNPETGSAEMAFKRNKKIIIRGKFFR